MVTKKSAKVDVSKARLSALKKIGLLPNVSARGNLDASTKKKIATQWKKYHDIANAPKDEFHRQDVSDFFPGQIKSIQASGITVINGKAYVRKEGMKTAKIVKVKYSGEAGRVLMVERKYNDRKTEREIIGTPVEIAAWRERLVRDYAAGKMKEGDYVGLKAFDNATMARSIGIDLNTIFKYEAQIDYHGKPDEVRKGLRLVVISIKDQKALSENERTSQENQRRKSQVKRKKNQTATRKITTRARRK